MNLFILNLKYIILFIIVHVTLMFLYFHAIINKNFAFNFKYFKPKINNQKKKVFLILPDNAISPQIMATELIEFKKKFKQNST